MDIVIAQVSIYDDVWLLKEKPSWENKSSPFQGLKKHMYF